MIPKATLLLIYLKTNNMIRITATAPTVYQTQSLRAFNIGCKANGNGSYTGNQDFNTIREAVEYLTERANKYNAEDPEGTTEKLADMYADIAHGCLTLDAVTARIEEVEN